MQAVGVDGVASDSDDWGTYRCRLSRVLLAALQTLAHDAQAGALNSEAGA